MKPDELSSAETSDEQLTDKRNGLAPSADDALLTELAALAERIAMDSDFAAVLETRLQQTHRATLSSAAPTLWQRFSQAFSGKARLAYGVGLALLLSLFIAIPVLAYIGTLKFFTPVEVATLPSAHSTSLATFVPPRPANLTELEKAIGFSILTPAYLPADCKFLQSAQTGKYNVAWLSYACFDIYEAKQQTEWAPLKEPVPPNSVQTLTLNGQPALYMEDMTSDSDSNYRRLIFERADVLIQIFAIPGTFQNGMREGLISKAELIKIAESMK